MDFTFLSASFLLTPPPLRIFVSRLKSFSPNFRRLALILCFWPAWFYRVSFSESWAVSIIWVVVSDPNFSFRISMSKFSLAMMARWNWSIQLVDWVGGSTVWFSQKAGVPRRFESVDCAILRCVQIPLVY